LWGPQLPDVYDPDTWQRKTDAVFNHIFASYFDDGHSVYDEDAWEPGDAVVAVAPAPIAPELATRVNINEIIAGRPRPDQGESGAG
jgi:hypothetical protein